ncbi:MAG: SigE family RNA polymerase sigma factor [Candidatus Dormibacteria bacterium]
MTPFAERIRESFEDMKRNWGERTPAQMAPTEPVLYGRSWDGIVELPRDTFNSVELDAVYAAVVRSYQRGPRSVWGPVLLELLAPAMLEKVQGLYAAAPALSEDDIEQQLVIEVLRWAEKPETGTDQQYMDGRMMNRTHERVLRWLRRALASSGEPIEDHEELEFDYRREEMDEIADLWGGEVSREDVLLVYRAYVWGEPLARLALEQGVPVGTVFSRISRARARLQEQLPRLRPRRQVAA